MDWIKKNYEKFLLLLVSLALIGSAVYLFLQKQSFLSVFDNLKTPVAQNNNVPPLDVKPMIDAETALKSPTTWAAGRAGSLFVSQKYLLKDGVLYNPFKKGVGQEPLHPPLTNEWILKYNLDITDNDILTEDADGDGFSNLDEFLAKTDPTDKNSHPAYTTKLRLMRYIQVKFRLKFSARPDADSFQINTLDVNQPSQILKVGDDIKGTKFKIIKFTEKHEKDIYGTDQDASELTIQNVETSEQVILVYGRVANSPDSYAQFKYLWDTDPKTSIFGVKKDQYFSLKPEMDVQYKLIDINDHEAVIETQHQDKITIPLLEH